MGLGWVGGVEKWRLKLTSAKVEVEVEAELGNKEDRLECQKNDLVADIARLSTSSKSTSDGMS